MSYNQKPTDNQFGDFKKSVEVINYYLVLSDTYLIVYYW